jgi:hypothetical protein
MFQPATLGLCISLLAEVFPMGPGSRVDVAAGARAELNVGRIPVNSIDSSEPGTEEKLELRSGIRWISRTSSFVVKYTPQYYLRLPDILGVGRPLFPRRLDLKLADHDRNGDFLMATYDVVGPRQDQPGAGEG